MTKSTIMVSRKSTFATIAAVLVLLLAAFAAIGIAPESHADEVVFPSSVAVKSSYTIGETFTVSDATVSEGDKEYAANGVLIAPSGKAYSKATVILSEAGRYTLRYVATTDSGKFLTVEKTFNVVEDLFSIGKNSVAEYATGLGKNANREGLKVKLASGETFRYSKSVNIKDFSKNDKVLSLIVLPEKLGTQEINRLYIDFIDAYDPTNVVRIACKASPDSDWPTTYCSAGATGQPSVGLEEFRTSNIVIDGKGYKLHVDDDYGACPIHSFTGKTGNGYGIENREIALEIAWDYAEKRLYATTSEDKPTGGLITDLDDPALYDSIWEGFTTGDVYVEITGGGYSGSSATMLFTYIAGDDLTKNQYVDDDKPAIDVDLCGYESAPDAQVGKEYPVFAALARDVHDGYLDVDVSAYYNYGSGTYAEIQIKNGKFVPDRTGEVTLVYTATDAAGNMAKVEYVINVKEPVTLAATVNNDALAGKTGETSEIASLLVTSMYDDYKVTAEAVLVSDENVRYAVDGDTLTFVPLYAGEYKIIYKVADFLETIEVEASFTVGANENSLILGDAILPRYFIKNATYNLPAIDATSFDGGKPQTVRSKIYVAEDGGERIEVVSSGYTVLANKTVTVTYASATGDEKNYTVPVKNVGYGGTLDLTKYFDTEGFTATAAEDGITFTAGGDGKHTAAFINPVLAEPIRLEFSVPKNRAGFDKFLLTLTDSENPTETLTVTYEKNDKGVKTYVGDGVVSVSEKKFSDFPNFTFVYYNDGVTLYADRTSDYNTRVLLPSTFKGFSSHKVYVSFEIEGVDTSSAIKITKLNNQLIDNSTVDETVPESTVKSRRGNNDIGTVVALDEVIFCDVLDPTVSATLKVTAPDKSNATDLAGVTLDGGSGDAKSPCVYHEIKLEKYGRYSVTYTATDGSDNVFRYSYIINVSDVNAPVIMLSDAAKSAKVGETVKIASATVTDDFSKDLVASVYLTLPDGRVIKMDGTAFVADRKGRFLVTYYVTDEAGNAAMESYAVTVE